MDERMCQAPQTLPLARTTRSWAGTRGHVNADDVALIENHDLARGVHVTDKTRWDCESCRAGKQTRSQKAATDTSSSAPTDVIGAVLGIDLKTDVKTKDYRGNAHSIRAVDYASSYGEVHCMRAKSD